MNLEKTKDYSKFKMFTYNRSVDEGRVEKLIESIIKYGFLMPILVNQNYLVVDGQHRLEAAKKANVEVSYVMYELDEDKIPLLVSKVNSLSKNWTLQNYFNMWHELKIEEYVYIGKCLDEHNVDIGIAHSLLIRGHLLIEKFKNGELKLTEQQKERFEKRLKQFTEILTLSEAFKEFNQTGSFKRAITKIIVQPNYDHDHMLKKLEATPGKIQKTTSQSEYIEMFQAAYNHGLKNRIRFQR